MKNGEDNRMQKPYIRDKIGDFNYSISNVWKKETGATHADGAILYLIIKAWVILPSITGLSF